MKKLIETYREFAVVCDNEECLYTIKNEGQDTKQYINKLCPSCGENLLTQKDYDDDERVLRTVAWINKYFSWLQIFYNKQGWQNERNKISVHCHNGVKIKK